MGGKFYALTTYLNGQNGARYLVAVRRDPATGETQAAPVPSASVGKGLSMKEMMKLFEWGSFQQAQSSCKPSLGARQGRVSNLVPVVGTRRLGSAAQVTLDSVQMDFLLQIVEDMSSTDFFETSASGLLRTFSSLPEIVSAFENGKDGICDAADTLVGLQGASSASP